ncbi:MAG: hypothetical protein KDA41_17730 [Planctomycetales bacterium]|nr:hypothetical protein [Planctomycetales bacterium]
MLKAGGPAGSPRRVVGEITEYTGRELLIRTAGGRENRIASDRIDEVFFTKGERHVDGDELFAERKYSEALARYQQAISDEPRTWVRREILAQMVWCQRGLGNDRLAATTFLLIVESDPTTPHFDAIPLAWRPMTLDLAAERQAVAWLNDQANPAARLIAASWLLSGPAETRNEAKRTLDLLTNDRSPYVAPLAAAQLWRTQLVLASAADAERWRVAIERLPPTLRGGPYYLLGQLLARHQDFIGAALALMRVPVHYSRERALAAEALLSAADALERAAMPDESRQCLRELTEQFGETQAAAAARSKMSP